MIENAISKVRGEMDQNRNNPYIQVIGGFLLQHLAVNPVAAEKILAQDKTIGKSLDEMKKAAEKKKVGNCAVLTDQEGFEIVLKYFGIDSTADSAAPVQKDTTHGIHSAAPAVPALDFEIGLEDLL